MRKFSILLILLSANSLYLVANGVKPKALTDSEKAEIYKHSAKRHALAAEMARIRELYAQKLNEELARLRAEQQKAEETLSKLLDAKAVEGYSLDDELNYIERKPKPESSTK